MGDTNILAQRFDRLLEKWKVPMTRVKMNGSPLSFHRLQRGNLQASAIDHFACSQAGAGHVSRAKVNRQWDLSDHWPIILSVRGTTSLLDDSLPSQMVIPFYKPKMLLASKTHC